MLRSHFECKIENQTRLRNVKNLEELVGFQIKTITDKLTEEGVLVDPTSSKKGLYSLRKVVDPLLLNSNFPQISKVKHPGATSSASGMARVKRGLKSRSLPAGKRLKKSENTSNTNSKVNLNADYVDERHVEGLPDGDSKV